MRKASPFLPLLLPGLVFPRPSICPRRVLRKIRGARLFPPPVLLVRPPRRGREWISDCGPHPHALLLRVLCQSCSW